MRKVNIQTLDLNLLIALKALLEEKHVTRAATRIGLSQPATSRALGRLREMLDDPLLVKGESGLELSARAEELYPSLLNAFAEINHVITPPSHHPGDMKGEIVIATRDNEMVYVLPQALDQISKQAPGLTFRVIQQIGDDLSLLGQNKVDFILTGTQSESASLHCYTLYSDDFICLMSAKNPAVTKFNLETFLQMKHCMVTITGHGPGPLDRALAEKGLKRNITLKVPYFLSAAHMTANSDMVATLPRKIGQLLSQQNNFVILEPPIKLPSFSIYLYWHTRNQNNPTHQWIRSVIREHA